MYHLIFGHTVYKQKHLSLEARRKGLVIHGCWSMNIGTVLIEHDYNASPLKERRRLV